MATPFDNIVATQDDEMAIPMATEKQLSFLRSLMTDKAALLGLDADEAAAKLDAWLPTLDMNQASENIDKALDAVKKLRKGGAATTAKPAAPAQWESVVEGRYAIPTQDGAKNELAFYKVDRPTEGRWAGYVFVKRLVGPEEQRLSQKQSAAILAKIGEFGAEKASKLYGKEIGHCGVCGRRLTNDESREAGIGPICAQGLGW